MLYTPSFFAMAAANFCVLTSFSSFFLFPIFISDHGGNHIDIGLLMGAFGLASVLCRPTISNSVDRLGRKRNYSIGTLAMGLLPLSYLLFEGNLADYYIPLFIIRLLHGVAFALCITTAFTYIADLIPPDRLNEGIGIFGISGLAGSAVGPAIGELIIKEAGFPGLFLAASGISFIGFLLHLPVPEVYVRHSRVSSETFFYVLRKRKNVLVAVLSFLFGIGLAAVNNFVTPFANEKFIPYISLYYVAYSVAAILTRLFGARLADSIGEEKIIPFALITMGAGLFTTVFISGSWVLLSSGFLTGTGHGFLYPSLNAFALRGESPGVRGKVTGIFTGSVDGGSFFGSILLGYVGVWSGFQMLFTTAGFCVLLGLLLLPFTRKGNGAGTIT